MTQNALMRGLIPPARTSSQPQVAAPQQPAPQPPPVPQAVDLSDFNAALDQYGRLVIDMDGDGVPDLVIPQNR